MSRRRIAYYAHDSGSGHLRHAANVARHPEFDVLLLTGGEGPVDGPWVDVIQLSSDMVPDYEALSNAPFHYVPTSPTIRRRFDQIHEALNAFAPDVVIVDVSAEVTAFVKLCGYPVIVRRMHGDRTDRAHQNMYDTADALIAYYPRAVESAATEPALASRTSYVGMLELPQLMHSSPSSRTVVVQTSLGGNGVDLGDIDHAAATTPGWVWKVAGKTSQSSQARNVEVLGHVEDMASLLGSATVIVTATGHNAVRAAAAARRPTIFTPEPRMYDEQEHFARAISAVAGVPVVSNFRGVDWQKLLAGAQAQDSDALGDLLLVSDAQFYETLATVVDAVIR